jgi:hypothetical protein
VEQKVERYEKLLQVGQIITSEMNLEALFPFIIQHTNSIMDCQASSIFLYDKKSFSYSGQCFSLRSGAGEAS